MAVAPSRWHSDRDEDRVRRTHGLGKFGGKPQSTFTKIMVDQLGKSGLGDRHVAALERFDLALVPIHAGDMVTEIGKARSRHETNIAGANHRNVHWGISFCFKWQGCCR